MISLANDDVCYQDGGNSYVRGYSGGAQKRWLEQELERSRGDKGIDWIVVCMHQTAVSTGDRTNGADLGIRENWLPLFDRFNVDLVVCGHEHHYERSHAIRGTLPTDTLTPNPVGAQQDQIDTSKGTVHLVIGGGGTSIPSNRMFFPEPRCQVLMSVGDVTPDTGKKAPRYVAGGRTVVGVPGPRQPLWLRGIRRRPGPARRQHVDGRHVLRGERAVRRGHTGRQVHVDAAPD